MLPLRCCALILVLFAGAVPVCGSPDPGTDASLDAADGMPADADPVEVFRAFGLLGTWSPDCRRDPAPDNPRITWRNVNGVLRHTVSEDGRSLTLADTVLAAKMLDDDIIRFTVARRGRTALIVTLRMVDGRVHTVRSAAPDGHLYYDHGMELATGKPSMTYEPCAAVVSQRLGVARRT